MNEPRPERSNDEPTAPTSPVTTGSVAQRMVVNTISLAGSNLWRILVSFLLQLLITRQLGLEGLGGYTIVMAYLNVGQVLSELGLPGLLVRDLAQHPQLRLSYFRTALWLQLAASLLTWGGLAVLAWFLPLPPPTQLALVVVGASLPLAAVTSVTQTLFQAGERMELVLSVEGIINTLILAASAAALWWGAGLVVIVGLLVVTQALSALLGLWLVGRSGLLAEPQVRTPLPLSSLTRRLPPFYGLAVADVLLQRVDILLLSVVAGETITAIYSAAYQLVRVLYKVIQSFWRALYPTLSRLYQQAQQAARRVARRGLQLGLALLVPGVVIIALLAQSVLTLVFGPTAALAAPVLQILLWSAPLFLIESYAATLLMVEQQPTQSLWISGLHVLGIVLLLPPMTTTWQATGAAWAVVMAGVISAIVGLVLVLRNRTAASSARYETTAREG